jgi:hypothetical protein
MNSIKGIRLAKAWRKENPERVGGVVVVFQKNVTGWINELRDPQHFVAGCIAIDDQNNRWQAVGGNHYDGAREWVAAPKTGRDN